MIDYSHFSRRNYPSDWNIRGDSPESDSSSGRARRVRANRNNRNSNNESEQQQQQRDWSDTRSVGCCSVSTTRTESVHNFGGIRGDTSDAGGDQYSERNYGGGRRGSGNVSLIHSVAIEQEIINGGGSIQENDHENDDDDSNSMQDIEAMDATIARQQQLEEEEEEERKKKKQTLCAWFHRHRCILCLILLFHVCIATYIAVKFSGFQVDIPSSWSTSGSSKDADPGQTPGSLISIGSIPEGSEAQSEAEHKLIESQFAGSSINVLPLPNDGDKKH